MTWYFETQPGGRSVTVFDHDGTRIAEDVSISWPWHGVTLHGERYPLEVRVPMYDATVAAAADNNTEYALRAALDAAFDDIQQGTPPGVED